ncbi:MAG: Uma2 family endonuclease, partial [Myxococcales bacterium]|nr:Uma2 family endonuclease [Myxococcales bacterium]
MSAATQVRMSYAEYLASEEKSAVKHAYLRGEVYAMAGGTPEHARLAAATISELTKALAGRPCVVFTSDLRVRIL